MLLGGEQSSCPHQMLALEHTATAKKQTHGSGAQTGVSEGPGPGGGSAAPRAPRGSREGRQGGSSPSLQGLTALRRRRKKPLCCDLKNTASPDSQILGFRVII